MVCEIKSTYDFCCYSKMFSHQTSTKYLWTISLTHKINLRVFYVWYSRFFGPCSNLYFGPNKNYPFNNLILSVDYFQYLGEKLTDFQVLLTRLTISYVGLIGACLLSKWIVPEAPGPFAYIIEFILINSDIIKHNCTYQYTKCISYRTRKYITMIYQSFFYIISVTYK